MGDIRYSRSFSAVVCRGKRNGVEAKGTQPPAPSHDFKTVYDAWHREIQKSVKDRMAAIGDAAMDNITSAIRLKGDLRASEFVVKHLLTQKHE